MASKHGDRFNHDPDAAGYDRDVVDESNPIRAGYDELLTWVAAQVPPGSLVVDLGSGTGNLARRIRRPTRLVCVDISEEMHVIARAKLADLPCEQIRADLLDCIDLLPNADAIASTYAIHHLTDDEKPALFRGIYDHLRPGGVAALGDLMFASRADEQAICAAYTRAGKHALVAAIRDEFFWYVNEAEAALEAIGFATRHRRFSQLSWGIVAEKPGQGRTGGDPKPGPASGA